MVVNCPNCGKENKNTNIKCEFCSIQLIDENRINQYGVVSKEIAYDMAQNGSNIINCDLCISFTGNAGPTAMENKPVGLIYIGIAFFKTISTYCFQLNGSREQIREQAIYLGCNELLKLLKTEYEL